MDMDKDEDIFDGYVSGYFTSFLHDNVTFCLEKP